MLSLEEREIRRKQLGASEIYKILNFDSQVAQDLWELKLGLQDYQELENDAITSGNILEEDCLKYYEKTTNHKLNYNERIEHPLIKNLVVSLDARDISVEGNSIPIENKVINENTFNKWIAKKAYNAEYGDIKLNISSYELEGPCNSIKLSLKEFEIMRCFIQSLKYHEK